VNPSGYLQPGSRLCKDIERHVVTHPPNGLDFQGNLCDKQNKRSAYSCQTSERVCDRRKRCKKSFSLKISCMCDYMRTRYGHYIRLQISSECCDILMNIKKCEHSHGTHNVLSRLRCCHHLVMRRKERRKFNKLFRVFQYCHWPNILILVITRVEKSQKLLLGTVSRQTCSLSKLLCKFANTLLSLYDKLLFCMCIKVSRYNIYIHVPIRL
jgi:hypothetical protein